MSRILIGETQEDFAVALDDYFSMAHYLVQVENNGLRILDSLRDGVYDAIILEITLPGIDGISVVKGFRATSGTTPIVLLAGRHSSEELQSGLDAGADAYLVKPFRMSDLAAQVRALLRRPLMRCEGVLIRGGLEMDPGAGTVNRNDVSIHLHPMEFKLLKFLLLHPNQVFSAEAIYERVWQKDVGQVDDTVRTHVRTLRRKIDVDGGPSIITTVRGLGYKTEAR